MLHALDFRFPSVACCLGLRKNLLPIAGTNPLPLAYTSAAEYKMGRHQSNEREYV